MCDRGFKKIRNQHLASFNPCKGFRYFVTQKAFCEEYLQSLNATIAYKKVYGVSHNVAKASSARLLANVNAKNYIALLQQEQKDMSDLDSEMVLAELKKIAFSDITDIVSFGPEGATKKIVKVGQPYSNV